MGASHPIREMILKEPQPPLSPRQIPDAYRKALALQNAGRLEEALSLYERIVSVNPKIAEVHFQVARIFASVGKFAKALPHVRAAQRIKPKEPAIWALWAEILIGLGDRAEIGKFENALRRASLPGPAKARIRRLLHPDAAGKAGKNDAGEEAPAPLLEEIAALLKSDPQAARTRAAEALKAHPRATRLLHLLARAEAASGDKRRALDTCDRALAIDPADGDLHLCRGQILLELGHPVEAAEALRRAVHFSPKSGAAHAWLGRALLKLERIREAKESIEKAEETEPENPDVLRARGLLAAREEDDEAAARAFARALEKGGEDALTHALLARALGALRREEEALSHFDRAIALDPALAFAHARRATLHQARGDFEAAEADFRKAIELEPTNGETYRIFSASHRFRPDDPLLERMREIWEREDLGEKDRMNLGFALAKAMEDIKAHDRVFTYLRPANDLMRKRFPYDINTRIAEVEKVKNAFEGFDFSQSFDGGDDSSAPIFVTGMPRSGTTLVEQIIASHSRVTAAGEVGEFAREGYRLIARPKGAFRRIEEVAPEEITALGRHYSDYMGRLFPEAERITDKSIQTYLLMGLVKLALPRAHVVVVRRDPRDNLLSIYKNVFHEGTHRYAYNLSDLGRYYRLFEEMIDFWREKLPGYFHEISYDDLTANPEEESRKLLAACDLEWEDQCLEFHKNRNRVDTLSLYQVRQPIYRSSVKAWERYESELGELFEALGDAGAQSGG